MIIRENERSAQTNFKLFRILGVRMQQFLHYNRQQLDHTHCSILSECLWISVWLFEYFWKIRYLQLCKKISITKRKTVNSLLNLIIFYDLITSKVMNLMQCERTSLRIDILLFY